MSTNFSFSPPLIPLLSFSRAFSKLVVSNPGFSLALYRIHVADFISLMQLLQYQYSSKALQIIRMCSQD